MTAPLPDDGPVGYVSRRLYLGRVVAQLEAEVPRVAPVAQKYLRKRIRATRELIGSLDRDSCGGDAPLWGRRAW